MNFTVLVLKVDRSNLTSFLFLDSLGEVMVHSRKKSDFVPTKPMVYSASRNRIKIIHGGFFAIFAFFFDLFKNEIAQKIGKKFFSSYRKMMEIKKLRLCK